MTAQKYKLTHQRLLEVLSYEKETGIFKWQKIYRKPQYTGVPAGCKKANGYVYINVDNVGYLAHRLAYFYETGCVPEMTIDHIDGNKANNAFRNLRDVSHLVNSQNKKKANSDNKSGLLGVAYISSLGMYKAQIRTNGRVKALGHFETPEAAHSAYISAKRELHQGCTI